MAPNTSRVFGKSATSNETFGEFPDIFVASEVAFWSFQAKRVLLLSLTFVLSPHKLGRYM